MPAKKLLTATQLKNLEQHKYSSEGVSFLEPYFQVFWRWLVEWFPKSIAPNTITMIGLAVNAASSFMLIYYCPNAISMVEVNASAIENATDATIATDANGSEQVIEFAPRWVYFVNAIGLFIYQSLDAIDGKQARRTNSSTPLGELFDHGCDSISTILVALSFACALNMGKTPYQMGALCLSSCVSFYASHWCSYVIGKLQFGIFDVTELQVGVIFAFTLTGILGPNVWNATFGIPYFQLRYLPYFGIVVGAAILYYRVYNIILDGGCGLNGSTIANTSVLSPSLNIGAVVVFFFLIISRSKLLEVHPVLFLFYIGLVSAKVTNCLIVAHMTRSELELLDPYIYGLVLLFLNQYFEQSITSIIGSDNFITLEKCLLIGCFIHSVYDLIKYLNNVYREISQHLNIYIFSLQARPDKNS